MQRTERLNLLTILVAYVGFIGLGMTFGQLGVAWPSMQKEFGVPLDANAVLFLANTVGYLSASFLSGTLAYRFGAGRMLAGAALLSALGLFAIALNHTWWLMTLILLVAGFGGGIIDAGTNAYVAQHHGARAMNWLHGSFGIGATVGPLLMTAVLSASLSWRVGYAIAGGVMIAVAILYAATRSLWHGSVVQNAETHEQRKSIRDVLRMPVVWMGIALFFLYAGLEQTPGAWAFTLFTEGRGIAQDIAGLWVSVYWASFTIGRFFFGAIITRVNTLALTRFCMVGVIAGALLFWLNPGAVLSFAGLTLIGFMEAPLFPIFVSNTPKRVGMENAGNAIGFQVAGAGIGIAVLPSLAGILANRISLEVIPPFMLAVSLLVIALHEVSVAQGARIERRAAASAGD